jgi:hypothetical protein
MRMRFSLQSLYPAADANLNRTRAGQLTLNRTGLLSRWVVHRVNAIMIFVYHGI